MKYARGIKVVLLFAVCMAAAACVSVTSQAAGAPTGLRQTNADRTGVEVRWDAVERADAYQVQISQDGLNWTDGKENAVGASIVLRGLNTGATYYVRVASYDTNGTPDFTLDDTKSEYSAPLEVVTAPDAINIGAITCTNATSNSLTFTWGACAGATSYRVHDYSNGQQLAVKTDTTFEWTGLLSSATYGIKVVPIRTAVTTGYEASVNAYGLSGVKTVPQAPKLTDFTVSAASSKATTVNFVTGDEKGYADGSEVEVCLVKGGAKVQTLTAMYDNQAIASMTNSMFIKRNQPYKYRMRYYIMSGQNKFYSEWSGYRYFFLHNTSGTKKVTSKGCSIVMKWSKVTGASGYTVLISTKRNGTYTKVKTLGKNSKGVTITKIGKKKVKKDSSYYIKVVPKVKDAGKTIANDTQVINTSLQ